MFCILVFHAIYLNLGTSQELIEKLAHLFHASPSVIVDIHLLGANNIHILVTDEVVQNMPDNSQYVIEVLKSKYCFVCMWSFFEHSPHRQSVINRLPTKILRGSMTDAADKASTI